MHLGTQRFCCEHYEIDLAATREYFSGGIAKLSKSSVYSLQQYSVNARFAMPRLGKLKTGRRQLNSKLVLKLFRSGTNPVWPRARRLPQFYVTFYYSQLGIYMSTHKIEATFIRIHRRCHVILVFSSSHHRRQHNRAFVAPTPSCCMPTSTCIEKCPNLRLSSDSNPRGLATVNS